MGLLTGLLRTDPEWKTITTAANTALADWKAAALKPYFDALVAFTNRWYGNLTATNASIALDEFNRLRADTEEAGVAELLPYGAETSDGYKTWPHKMVPVELNNVQSGVTFGGIARFNDVLESAKHLAAGGPPPLSAEAKCAINGLVMYQGVCMSATDAARKTAWQRWLAGSSQMLAQLQQIGVEGKSFRGDITPRLQEAESIRDSLERLAITELEATDDGGPRYTGLREGQNLAQARDQIATAYMFAVNGLKSGQKVASWEMAQGGTPVSASGLGFAFPAVILAGLALVWWMRR